MKRAGRQQHLSTRAFPRGRGNLPNVEPHKAIEAALVSRISTCVSLELDRCKRASK